MISQTVTGLVTIEAMTTLIRFALLCLMAASALAQSSLPACSGNFIYSDWSNCQGQFNWGNYIYSGEFLNNRPHGVGEKRNLDGSIIVSGVWKNGEFVNNQKFAREVPQFKTSHILVFNAD